MKAFHCDSCGSLVFFENTRCLKCSHPLGFAPDLLDLSALEPLPESNEFKALAVAARGAIYRLCRNGVEHGVCNWLVPASDRAEFCRACALNKLIPDLQSPANQWLWQKLEVAKRRMVYTLLKLRLPLEGNAERAQPPLRFQFLAEPPGGTRLMTGHADGVITINIAEADDAEREKRRVNLAEPFRTLLGHMRHEVAHYYWCELVEGSFHHRRFQELFGDERIDYSSALEKHYQQGAPADWQSRFVSAYASAHPWEDWAETTAHYFHMVDSMETAGSFGISLHPRHPDAKAMTAEPGNLQAGNNSFDRLLQNWLPLTYALNELNRGMGLVDLYPFVLSGGAVEKLRFVHDVLHEARA